MKIFSPALTLVSFFLVFETLRAQEIQKTPNPYQFMGQFDGFRLHKVSTEKFVRIPGEGSEGQSKIELSSQLRFLKLDYTRPGVNLIINFQEKETEKAEWADHFLFEIDLSLENYKKLFEKPQSITKENRISIGPDTESHPKDVYEINLASVNVDEKTLDRTIEIETEIGDYGKKTRRYLTLIQVKSGNLASLSHQKYAYTSFLGREKIVANFFAGDFKKTHRGLQLVEYGRLTKPKLIESAAEDSRPENFKRLIELEKEVN